MTAEYLRDWQQPRHAVGREGTGIPAPESALSSWLDAYGGIWNLYTLNNGGAFMAPEPDDDDDETWVLFNAMNGNRAEMRCAAPGFNAWYAAVLAASARAGTPCAGRALFPDGF